MCEIFSLSLSLVDGRLRDRNWNERTRGRVLSKGLSHCQCRWSLLATPFPSYRLFVCRPTVHSQPLIPTESFRSKGTCPDRQRTVVHSTERSEGCTQDVFPSIAHHLSIIDTWSKTCENVSCFHEALSNSSKRVVSSEFRGMRTGDKSFYWILW